MSDMFADAAICHVHFLEIENKPFNTSL